MSFLIRSGGTSEDTGKSTISLGDGISLVAGRFGGTATFGSTAFTSAGSSDIFIASLNADGSYAWATKAGGEGYDSVGGITTLSDGSAIIAGTFEDSATFGSTILTSVRDTDEGDVYIAKLDSAGNYLVATQFIEGVDEVDVAGITSLSDGNVIVTGNFKGTASFGGESFTAAGRNDIYVAKLDDKGNIIWATQASGADTTKIESADISSLNDGSSIVTGAFNGAATFGSTTLVSEGYEDDIFIAKLDDNGNYVWATTSALGISDSDGTDAEGEAISSLSDGSSLVSGIFEGTAIFGSTTLKSEGDYDTFIAKIDANGNYVWATSATSKLEVEPEDISSLNDGSSIVIGEFQGTASFGSTTLTSEGIDDIFIAKLDANGNYVWATSAGGTGDDEGEGISSLSDGSSIVTGKFSDTATFGSTTLISAGSSDIFVARLDPNGNWTSATPTPLPNPSPSPSPSPEPSSTPDSIQTNDGFTQFTDADDTLIGQANIKYRMMGGNDLLEVIGGSNYANGNMGEDTIILRGGFGDYLGGKDSDTFEVFAAEDGTSVNGNRGEDTITGSVSGVTYRGGKDNDTLAVSQGEAWGDLGVDVFRGVTGEGYAVIQDYTIGEDVVEIEMDGSWSNVGDGLMFTDDSGDQLMLLLGINNVEQVTRV